VKLEIYKRGQGKYTRIVTAVSIFGLSVIGAVALSGQLSAFELGGARTYVQFGIPTLLVMLMGLFSFWLVNRPRTADFLIATESEMKKVSWSSRKEIIGSTKVVIVTTLILAMIIFGVDLLFVVLFQWLRIMG